MLGVLDGRDRDLRARPVRSDRPAGLSALTLAAGAPTLPVYRSVGAKQMSATKAEVESLLKTLPDDCTLEDVQYHLYVLEKVKAGLDRADREGGLTQAQVEERLRRWTAV